MPEEWPDIDEKALQETMAQVMPQVVRFAEEVEWNQFWAQVESVLQSQSLDDMAWMMSAVNVAYEYVNTVPEAQPLADWLRQRRDYFDMAGMAVQQVPDTGPVQSVSALGRATSTFRFPEAIRSVVPAGAPLRPASPQVVQRRLGVVQNETAWKTKLRGRSLPPQAGQLIPRLKEVFDSEGIAPKWVWIAEVESSLNPKATSPVGAVGLFQLMPDTAKRFGLRTFPFDDRMKPEKNARAAAQYLKMLHQQFGCWSLALAAYNAGEGKVGRIMKQHRAGTFDEVARHLPLETRMYVPKVMATVALREDQANGVPYAFISMESRKGGTDFAD